MATTAVLDRQFAGMPTAQAKTGDSQVVAELTNVRKSYGA